MLYIGADHGGWRMKEDVKNYLERKGIPFKDLGNRFFELRDDYPDWATKVARAVQKSKIHRGILFCGNGVGVCIVANKYRGVRAGIGYSTYAARSARKEDDINVFIIQ